MSLGLSAFSFRKTPRFSQDRPSSCRAANCEGPTPRRRHAGEMLRPSIIATIRATEHNDLPTLAKFLVFVYQFGPSHHHADPQLLDWTCLRASPLREGRRSYVLERDGQSKSFPIQG